MYYVIISTVLYFSFRYVISHTVTVFKVSFRPFSLVTDEGLRPKRFSIKFLLFNFFTVRSCPSSLYQTFLYIYIYIFNKYLHAHVTILHISQPRLLF